MVVGEVLENSLLGGGDVRCGGDGSKIDGRLHFLLLDREVTVVDAKSHGGDHERHDESGGYADVATS
ncbi:UNVERIFIED_ORG: hypothetical protein J2W85_002748 [Ensifer adhaerens]|nr:hypothetical protein [Ensifer adhaerens]